MTQPPGMIGLACGEPPRYSDFIPAIVQLQKPYGSLFDKKSGLGPAHPFNIIGRNFLNNKKLQWLFLTNDDNLCPADTILRLLDHNVDVCTGFYLNRHLPFVPVLFDRIDLAISGKNVYNRWKIRSGDAGLKPVIACGDGCLLIRRHVLENIPYPWWEYGETSTFVCDHDMGFSYKVITAGFRLFCDLSVKVVHMTNFGVQPHQDEDGNWFAELTQGGGEVIRIPLAVK